MYLRSTREISGDCVVSNINYPWVVAVNALLAEVRVNDLCAEHNFVRLNN